jgi:hypothetical protein
MHRHGVLVLGKASGHLDHGQRNSEEAIQGAIDSIDNPVNDGQGRQLPEGPLGDTMVTAAPKVIGTSAAFPL